MASKRDKARNQQASKLSRFSVLGFELSSRSYGHGHDVVPRLQAEAVRIPEMRAIGISGLPVAGRMAKSMGCLGARSKASRSKEKVHAVL